MPRAPEGQAYLPRRQGPGEQGRPEEMGAAGTAWTITSYYVSITSYYVSIT